MGDKTKIDWCDSTWNPVTGCYHDCQYCYARGIAKRFSTEDKCHSFYDGKPMGKIRILDNSATVIETGKKSPYPFGFEPTFHRYKLDEYATKKGRNIFVCSMADLFGDWVPDSWLDEVFEACEKAPQHNYLFLTKKPKRYIDYDVSCDRNKWYGTSICKNTDMKKCEHLPLRANKFISIEPILECLDIISSPIINWVDWVIVGAETGRRKDKVIPQRKWIEDIVNECKANEKPVFMKSSLADIWGEPLIQKFPRELKHKED